MKDGIAVTVLLLAFAFHEVDAKPVPKNIPQSPKIDNQLQGDWIKISMKRGGKEVQPGDIFTIKGDQWAEQLIIDKSENGIMAIWPARILPKVK